MKVNLQKCRIFYAGIDRDAQEELVQATDFQKEQLPFKYLGVSVASKKMPMHCYMPLIDRIIGKIKHWSARLLTYVGRLQLIKSVTFALTNYWLQCFPFPENMIYKIEAICRNFLWTDGFEGSRKAPISWKKVCCPKCRGGLNIIDIEVWNKTNQLRLLWNLSGKTDSLCVRWIQAYYLKNKQLMEIQIKPNHTWIMKAILKQRDTVQNMDDWENIMNNNFFNMSHVYYTLQCWDQKVKWRDLMYGNMARPRACFIMWLACQSKLSTKDRLFKFGMIDNTSCCFCLNEESINHLFFICLYTRNIWLEVLAWIQVQHNPVGWEHEIDWLIQQAKGKSARVVVIKMAITKTIYEIIK
ncbi:uncharacterized protein LOC131658115 [Vicia villosa]|uniref:uncharacterized protein LOC131658115 n=1 Tax=Vicia villosa TaxID=3911 RepID=UPI00273A7C47|nr:uncharacterized protein LOC131658115 [Vicia villosa]